MNKAFLLLFSFLLVNSILAVEIGYIVSNPSNLDTREIGVKNFLVSEGHAVTILDDSITSENKQIFIVSHSVDSLNFDLTNYKSLIMNNELAKKVGLSRAYGTSSGRSINLEKVDFITEDYSLGSLNVYTSSSSMDYVVSCFGSGTRNLAYKSDKSRSVILIADTNAKLLNSAANSCSGVKTIKERIVYFGLTDSSKWNNDSKELFRRSLLWLLTGGQTDKDGDGYYSLVSGGNDCDDALADVNPASTDINKNCKNDPPTIVTFNPNINPKILKNKDKEFSATSNDEIGSILTHVWKIDNNEVGVETKYVFNKDIGNYIVSYTVSDGEFSAAKTWNVHVGSSTEFTCAEMSGFSCSVKEICKGETIQAKENNLCCSAAYSEKPPEFVSIRKRCINESSKIDLTIDDFADDDFNVHSITDFNVRIKNNLNEKKEFDIYTYVYDVTKEKVLKKQDKSITINKGAILASLFEMQIPDNSMEENEFAIFTYVESESGECKETYRKIDVQRKSDNVIVSNIDFKNDVYLCGDTADFDVTVKNLANEIEDASISLDSSKLFDEKTLTFELGKYGEDYTETKKFIVSIPETADAGTYEVIADVQFSGKKSSLKESLTLGECKTQEIIEDDLATIQLKKVTSLISESGENSPYLIIAIVYTSLFLLAVVIFYFVFRRR